MVFLFTQRVKISLTCALDTFSRHDISVWIVSHQHGCIGVLRVVVCERPLISAKHSFRVTKVHVE